MKNYYPIESLGKIKNNYLNKKIIQEYSADIQTLLY